MRFSAIFSVFMAIVCFYPASGVFGGETLTVFQAASFVSIMEKARYDIMERTGIKLKLESGGSQMACRKLVEMNRDCDIMLLADSHLFRSMASEKCSWRIEFLSDEMVLAAGIRAKYIDEAEKSWTSIFDKSGVVFGNVNAALAPAGYRALLVLKLQDESGILLRKFEKKCARQADDVAGLAALLKSGEADYGFIYRNSAISYDLRFIELERRINLGDTAMDYSSAEIMFRTPDGTPVTVRGSAITYGISIPDTSQNKREAVKVVKYIINDNNCNFKSYGFGRFKPRFYGSREAYAEFSDAAEYAGEF